jgi:hypothetical protein
MIMLRSVLKQMVAVNTGVRMPSWRTPVFGGFNKNGKDRCVGFLPALGGV